MNYTRKLDKMYKESLRESLSVKLVGNKKDGYEISKKDVDKIYNLKSTDKVTIGPSSALKDFSSGIGGDLSYRSNGVYSAEELQDWFDLIY